MSRYLLCVALAACGEGVETLPHRDPYAAAALPVGCLPNLDGEIASAEMPVVIGMPVTFRVSPPAEERSIDPVGAVAPDGVREWDWTFDTPSDQRHEVAALELAGRWYAASFPDGELVLPASAPGLEAIYSKDSAALRLHGFASSVEAPREGRTLLVYEPAVELVRFPIRPGASWSAAASVRNGTALGLPYAGDDVYEVNVAAAGRLVLPDLTFTQAHLIETALTVTPVLGGAYSVRQLEFVFECFGEVARATSRRGESRAAFTLAAEVRRLGL